MSAQGKEKKPVEKDLSMVRQKELISSHYDQLAAAPETGRKVVSTFVPGNLTELLRCFDAVPNLPEINALNAGMRQRSRGYIKEAENAGYSEDVCAYVKSDIGMILKNDPGPTGKPIPPPDLLLLSYTGCFTFMKWFELLRDHYKAETVMLHIPYQPDGKITEEMRSYVVKQLKTTVIPALEKVTGIDFDIDKLRAQLALSAKAEDDLVWVLEQGKRRPTPIDGYFGGVYYIGPIFTAFRGSQEAVDYYELLRTEVQARIDQGRGPITPDGELEEERYRLVVEGPPNWTNFREFWRMLADDGAVAVASTYTKVGGLYDTGFRHDPDEPLETLADYCLGCYTNLGLPARISFIQKYIEDYEADGFLINSVKSCNSFSAGQLLMLRELEERTGRPGAFIETDLVDPRYFSSSNVKNRLESYLQMIEQKRHGDREAS